MTKRDDVASTSIDVSPTYRGDLTEEKYREICAGIAKQLEQLGKIGDLFRHRVSVARLMPDLRASAIAAREVVLAAAAGVDEIVDNARARPLEVSELAELNTRILRLATESMRLGDELEEAMAQRVKGSA